MRWRLLRRRLSISAPRMAVRSHLPWPLRWAAVAVMLGFSGALALWAFEFGRGLAGLHGRDLAAQRELLTETRQQLDAIRRDRDQAQAIANSADSLLTAERATQRKLVEQVRALEAENQALKADLGFFERLLPASGEGLSIRGLQVESAGAAQWRFQLLVMQQGARGQADFRGRVEVSVNGLRDGKPWLAVTPVLTQPLQFRQYRRVEGLFAAPAGAPARQVQVRVLDEAGAARAVQVQAL
ncbi:DUF6776 family protein [Aquabacterium sp.]|uniref:DUF6776 family protein n=1 Tax=Aquabacterium sp. TaxID=1872578 RepID=UPI0035C720DF